MEDGGELVNDGDQVEATDQEVLLPTESTTETAADNDNDAAKSSKMKSNSKSEKSRQAKKERKLVSTFLQKVLQLKGQQEVREVTFGQPTSYRCLLLDNRDYQLKQSTEELLALIQNRGHGLIDDCFVLPSKLWTLLRFATSDDLATFREDLGGGDGFLATVTGITTSSPVSDQLYELTVQRFLSDVKQILSFFSNASDGAPQGLTVIEDFLSEEEEQALVQFNTTNILLNSSSDSCYRYRSIRFSALPPEVHLIEEDEEDEENKSEEDKDEEEKEEDKCRLPNWTLMALDRMRTQHDMNLLLAPIFAAEHRERIYQQRFAEKAEANGKTDNV